MLQSRCYSVLDTLVCEVVCVHLGDLESNHLLIREERRPYSGSVREALRHLGDATDMAVHLVDSRELEGYEGGWEGCAP